VALKPCLSWAQQVQLLRQRGLAVGDPAACEEFLAAQNYYRFSGYARYFQRAPQDGDDMFVQDTSFEGIRRIHDADEELRQSLSAQLAHAEILLRSHTAHVIADRHGPYRSYLSAAFYSDAPSAEPTVEACLRDIERGDSGSLAGAVASSLGIAQAGFAYRVRALVYLRNRCAHHSRLWNHSIIDAGPTPNNVRTKAKRLAGQFDPRSVLDVVASLDDILLRGAGAVAILPSLIIEHSPHEPFWRGLRAPQTTHDQHDHIP